MINYDIGGSTIERLLVAVTDNSSLTHFGQLATDVSGSTAAAAVPEPSSLLLLGCGLLGLCGFYSRRRR